MAKEKEYIVNIYTHSRDEENSLTLSDMEKLSRISRDKSIEAFYAEAVYAENLEHKIERLKKKRAESPLTKKEQKSLSETYKALNQHSFARLDEFFSDRGRAEYGLEKKMAYDRMMKGLDNKENYHFAKKNGLIPPKWDSPNFSKDDYIRTLEILPVKVVFKYPEDRLQEKKEAMLDLYDKLQDMLGFDAVDIHFQDDYSSFGLTNVPFKNAIAIITYHGPFGDVQITNPDFFKEKEMNTKDVTAILAATPTLAEQIYYSHNAHNAEEKGMSISKEEHNMMYKRGDIKHPVEFHRQINSLLKRIEKFSGKEYVTEAEKEVESLRKKASTYAEKANYLGKSYNLTLDDELHKQADEALEKSVALNRQADKIERTGLLFDITPQNKGIREDKSGIDVSLDDFYADPNNNLIINDSIEKETEIE